MKLIVSKPVVDLRSLPQEITARDFSHQDLRDSQLLFGESLICEEDHGEWLKVRAVEQPKYDPSLGWGFYPGWVKRKEVIENKNDLSPNLCVKTLCAELVSEDQRFFISLGTYLHGKKIDEEWTLVDTLPQQPLYCKTICLKNFSQHPLKQAELRDQIVQTAKQLVNQPYLWGGRTAFHPQYLISSVDCSGLVNLAYRANGRVIPRDAHDQYLKSKSLDRKDLQPSDLLFFAPLEKERITHVVMYIGNNQYIEAPETGSFVRIIDEGTLLNIRSKKYRFFYRSFL